MTAGRLTWI